MSRRLNLLGVVLCGGKSTRMKRNKAELPHPAGGSYLEYAIHRLRPLCEEVCIAGENMAVEANSNLSDIRVLSDPVKDSGPAAGLAAAMTYARQQSREAVLLTAVDTPFLTTEHLRTLCDVASQQRDQRDGAWLSTSQPICAVSDKDQRRQPLLAIYPTHCEPLIGELAQSSNRSLDRWIASQNFIGVPLPAVACQNINTPEDYQRACEVSL